jgi:hypothetical protein
LNGKLDNGFLLGRATRAQQSSPRAALYVGRRSDLDGYGFIGSINNVRMYSFPLTNSEILANMHGVDIHNKVARPVCGSGGCDAAFPRDTCPPRAAYSEPEDAQIPVAAAMFGVSVAVACVGFWPAAGWLPYLAASVGGGLLFLGVAPSTLPAFSRDMMPLVSLAGAASVALSVRRQKVT